MGPLCASSFRVSKALSPAPCKTCHKVTALLLVAWMGESRLGEVKSLVPKVPTVWFWSQARAHCSQQTVWAPASLRRRGPRPGHLLNFRGAPSVLVSGFSTFLLLPTSGECPPREGVQILLRPQEAVVVKRTGGRELGLTSAQDHVSPVRRGVWPLAPGQALTNIFWEGPRCGRLWCRVPMASTLPLC